MNLKEIINADLKTAMKERDKVKLITIRSIKAAILELEKSGKHSEITSDDEMKILTSVAKKRKEAIEQFEKAGRMDLANKEASELRIIENYLPKQLSKEEIISEIKKLAEQINAKNKNDFPKLMSLAVKTLKGKAGGKIIKEIVDKFLSDS